MSIKIQAKDDKQIRLIGDRETVELDTDEAAGDWLITHYINGGVGMPGGIVKRSDAIEYGLFLLGEIEETEARPIKRC